MPIYEFICQSCGNEFEQIRSFSDSSMSECTSCGSEQVVRRVGRPAIHFKGSGWYITDSKKGDSKNSRESSSGTSSVKSESTTESKSESSVETKSTSTTESAATPVAAD